MPLQWTPANLSFQISHDGVTYHNLLDLAGTEALLPVVPGSARMINIEPWSSGIGWWKFRSGPLAGPVIQAANRTFVVTLRPPGT